MIVIYNIEQKAYGGHAMESTRARYPRRSHRTPKTFGKARLTIAFEHLLCDHQSLLTRVHKSSSRVVLEEPLENYGNFFDIEPKVVDFMLTKHLTETSNNATYLSGIMHNKIIKSCGTLIQNKLYQK